MSNLRVTIVGAGVVGMSTACAFQRAFRNVEVTLIAAEFDAATTSHLAAGYFCPTADKAPTADLATLEKWVAASGEHYRHLATSADAEIAGVGVATFYELSSEADAPEPFFGPHAFSCRRLTDGELDRILPEARSTGVAVCHQAVTAYAQCDRYLPYLLNTLRTGGMVTIRRAKFSSLEEAAAAADDGCDLLFNCSGLGASELCRDPNVYPTRGQVVRVDAPMQKFALHGPGVQYVLPNRSSVVLGGTASPGSWDTSVSEADTADILSRTWRLVPHLRQAPVLSVHAGLRPSRRGGTRLELDHSLGSGTPVVHNYGHGANGVGLSWGSGVHAVELVTEALRGGVRRSKL